MLLPLPSVPRRRLLRVLAIAFSEWRAWKSRPLICKIRAAPVGPGATRPAAIIEEYCPARLTNGTRL